MCRLLLLSREFIGICAIKESPRIKSENPITRKCLLKEIWIQWILITEKYWNYSYASFLNKKYYTVNVILLIITGQCVIKFKCPLSGENVRSDWFTNSLKMWEVTALQIQTTFGLNSICKSNFSFQRLWEVCVKVFATHKDVLGKKIILGVLTPATIILK